MEKDSDELGSTNPQLIQDIYCLKVVYVCPERIFFISCSYRVVIS